MTRNNLTKLAKKMSKEDVRPDSVERGLGAYTGAKRGTSYGFLGALGTNILGATLDQKYGTQLKPIAERHIPTVMGAGGLIGAAHGALKPKSYHNKGVATTVLRSAVEGYAPLALSLDNLQLGDSRKQLLGIVAADQAIAQYARKRFYDRRKQEEKNS